MVSVKFLGCGDNFGSGGRFQTCISVQSEAAAFLIDCGASALISMKNHLNYRTLLERHQSLQCKRIVITHMSDDMLGRLNSLEFEYAEDGKEFFV